MLVRILAWFMVNPSIPKKTYNSRDPYWYYCHIPMCWNVKMNDITEWWLEIVCCLYSRFCTPSSFVLIPYSNFLYNHQPARSRLRKKTWYKFLITRYVQELALEVVHGGREGGGGLDSVRVSSNLVPAQHQYVFNFFN